MNQSRARSAGRPRASSRETLAEAAAELFVAHGYENVSVDQITQLAGVSRNTFFNYFESKADVLWVDFDALLDQIDETLRTSPVDERSFAALVRGLRAVAEAIDDATPRLVLGRGAFTLAGTEGARAEQKRMSALADRMAAFVAVRDNIDPLTTGAQTPARIAVALLQSALATWAHGADDQKTLAHCLDAALVQAARILHP